MFKHAPVNHPLRPVYRTIAAVASAVTVLIGAIGYFSTSSQEYFAANDSKVLGLLGMNPGHALLMVGSGVVMLLALLIGRNVDSTISFLLGCALMAVGTVGLLIMRTDANFLSYRMSNVIVAYVIGSLLMAAGLYLKSGRAAAAAH
ncbi:preprotein translocase subunit Sss1 [Hamadaea flava]|uniref:DUF4383 domain-containing protein n=1 Tax=Hamadaea flava TaxID=1742688 RepID=A0ABV8LHA6_9ACTN|nr:DUF4383 domain-containing protein [Hamadaea flava]MCP2325537.1 preprotein translocase subunit Sss1 [Hamadaea flava]